MARIQNKDIGGCDCPVCGKNAMVRRNKNHERGELYLVCSGKCGTLNIKNQSWYSGKDCNFLGLNGMEAFFPKDLSSAVPEQPKAGARVKPETVPEIIPSTKPEITNAEAGFNQVTGLII